MTAELELGPHMNQAELIEKVAQATELNQAAAGQAVKAVINAILDALVAGEAVRVSGLGTFNVAARPARGGRNPQTGGDHPNRSQQGSTVPRGQGRQRCPQSADSKAGSPEEDCTNKEIRGAEVKVLSMRGSAETAASGSANPADASSGISSVQRLYRTTWTAIIAPELRDNL
jgi:DNA-binding protein HU-beta